MWIVKTRVIEPRENHFSPDFQPDFEDYTTGLFGPFTSEEAAEEWTRIVGASPKMAGSHFELMEVQPIEAIIDAL